MSEPDAILKYFGQRVRELRKQNSISQEDFSFRCDLDRTYISDIELGKRNVSLLNVGAIATALDVPVAKLFIGFPGAQAPIGRTAAETYRIREAFRVTSGFTVTGSDVGESAMLTAAQLEALPFTLFQSIDLKSLSGMVGALFASNLAKKAGAMVNPIEKGHPDILPISAAGAAEQKLRNYPQGLEIKCTVGNVSKGSNLQPGQERISCLTGITWQAHHREVTGFVGLVIDFAGAERGGKRYPIITAAYFSNELVTEDWGAISGTTGRNTKVTGLRSTGKGNLAAGCIISLREDAYDHKYRKLLPLLPKISKDQ